MDDKVRRGNLRRREPAAQKLPETSVENAVIGKFIFFKSCNKIGKNVPVNEKFNQMIDQIDNILNKMGIS